MSDHPLSSSHRPAERPLAPAGLKLKAKLERLYFGEDRRARRFRYGLIAFDLATIAVFLLASVAREEWWMVPLDLAVATVMAADFAARLWIEPDRRRHLMSLATIADIAVIISLLLPALVDNLGFLRIARALRLLRSYHLLRDLRSESLWFRCNEEFVTRALNLLVFILVVTSVVYVTQNDVNPGIRTYIDALYFTITTLTTTGFGDITLQGPGGRLLSVAIMVVGVSLFLRLLQVIFRPAKVRFECPDCALLLHDLDAVHCKGCGRVLPIRDEGLS
ncbi:MAG: two pore domain potassium channel family protein [Microvirga sp.]|jgi:voltage-gated potassium channel|nr:two pore domain potassium channel family protein [Microvirga sp.]